MPQLTPEHRDRIIRLLAEGQELPSDDRFLLFPPERREYELVYAGKERREDILAETLSVPFQEVRTFGTPVEGEESGEWRNQLIFGDNLQAMRHLLDLKRAGKLRNADGTDGVRLIYIDPPFATKQEFRGSQDQKAYADKIAGAQFIEFLRRRLIMMHEILADDGSIFVHMDNKKAHYLKLILDEVFGENNFRNEIMLPGRAAKNLQQQFDSISRLNVRHDTLFWYSRSEKTKFSPLWVAKHNEGNPEGHWHHLWSNADRSTMRFEVFGVTPPNGQWVWGKERTFQAIDNYERFVEEGGGRTLAEYWRDTGSVLRFVRPSLENGSPQYWRAPATDRLADTVWSGIPIYASQTGYPTEKNEVFLSHVIELASQRGDIVLDGFMGSGTTLAVAEKLGRRWIGIDAGKLAIYTTQKRLLNLRAEIGNKGRRIEPRPFTLFNAGLYDFKTLKELPREAWRFFALQLFGCREEAHTLAGVALDGFRQGSHVLVFDHHSQPDQRIDEETIGVLHAKLGDKIGTRMFLIAPRGVFDFQEDYLSVDGVRYYALRIPYSVIEELHRRGFSTLRQPEGAQAVNDLVDAVGFDFVEPPVVGWDAQLEQPENEIFEHAVLETLDFESRWRSKGQILTGGIETLSMLMLDFDYDGQVFDLDKVVYADALGANGLKATWRPELIGEFVAAIWVDIHGNESFKRIPREQWSLAPLSDEEIAAFRARRGQAVAVESQSDAPEDETGSEEPLESSLAVAAPTATPAKAPRARRPRKAKA